MTSKVKLTGLRQVEHIGRLELVAAVVSVMLAVKICIALEIPLDQVLFFTDSMAVLYWLTTASPLSPYTGHRVAKICERTNWRQWKYVYTAENPSDLPTRGMRAEDLTKAILWMNGPEFLQKDPGDWPVQPHIRKTEEAAAEERTVEDICKGIIMTQRDKTGWKVLEYIQTRRNDLNRQVGILKRVCDFLNKYLHTNRFEKTRREVEETYVRQGQEDHFCELLHELKNNQITKTHPDLRPFLDEIGLIRVGSGLHPKAAFAWDTKRPLLLHANMGVAQALIKDAHYKVLGHQNGIEGLLAEVRKKYWIIGARKAAKKRYQRMHEMCKKEMV